MNRYVRGAVDGARLAALAVVGAGLAFVWPGPDIAERLQATVRTQAAGGGHGTSPAEWFERARPRCNAVEAAAHVRTHPAPRGVEGTGYAAACLALAGRIDDARERILSVEPDRRWAAAGIVFEAGHPAADAGDEIAAGPLMELVVEFWPNHYQALYHAGAAHAERGEREEARRDLERFLATYPNEDGWTRRAREMLEELR